MNVCSNNKSIQKISIRKNLENLIPSKNSTTQHPTLSINPFISSIHKSPLLITHKSTPTRNLPIFD